MNTQTLSLSTPLKTHDGELSVLTLREPNAGAFIDYGEPFKVHARKDDDGEPNGVDIEYNNKVMAKWLLSMIVEKLDEIVLKGLSARDYYQLRGKATDIVLLGVGDSNPT